jgi:hypothetical protein
MRQAGTRFPVDVSIPILTGGDWSGTAPMQLRTSASSASESSNERVLSLLRIQTDCRLHRSSLNPKQEALLSTRSIA